MERVEPVPYTTKQEIDANYKPTVTYGGRPERARVVHLAIVSHNRLNIVYGLLLRTQRTFEEYVECEILDSMANHQVPVVQEEASRLQLYFTRRETGRLHSAISYFVRRLDENTAEENFLHDFFDLEVSSPCWKKQKEAFLSPVQSQNHDHISVGPRHPNSDYIRPAYSR